MEVFLYVNIFYEYVFIYEYVYEYVSPLFHICVFCLLTVKSIVSVFPSAPVSLTAERNPSRKVFCLDVSTWWIGISATCSASLARIVRWAPIGPTRRKLPLKH